MKKSAQQKIVVLFIILIFGMSSIAYVINSVQNTEQQSIPSSLILDRELTPQEEAQFIQNGFTSFKFYYTNSTSQDLINYVNSLQETFKTDQGQVQVILQHISSDKTQIYLVSNRDEETIDNLTQQNIFASLCKTVTIAPFECMLKNLTATK